MRTVNSLLAALLLMALLACSATSPNAPEVEPLKINSQNTADTEPPPPPPGNGGGGGWF